MHQEPLIVDPEPIAEPADEAGRIVLLDLNGTLCERSPSNRPAYLPPDFSEETYRLFLVEAMRAWQAAGDHVILVTVRPQQYRDRTLSQIGELAGWQPDQAFFRDRGLLAPDWKRHVLRVRIMPRFGYEPSRYYAVESNPQTRAMYDAQGVAWTTQQVLRRDPSRPLMLP